MWALQDSNLPPTARQAVALPDELSALGFMFCNDAVAEAMSNI